MIKQIKSNSEYKIEFTKGDLSDKAMAFYTGSSVEVTQSRNGLDKGEFFMDGEPLGGDLASVDEAFCALYDDLPWWDAENN